MAEREVVKYPDPVLRMQTKSVSKIDPATKKLIREMTAIMHAANGVGLAANQVGSLQRLFVYDDGTTSGTLVNPEIVCCTGEQIGPEGCLSFPGLQGDVKRANEIVIKGLNGNGKPVKINAEGFLARVFQHEFDHLNGKLFIDRADPDTLYYPEDDELEEDE